MAYFTDPMGDEFKKAIEEAMMELERDEKVGKKKSKVTQRKEKARMKRLSKETRRNLK